MVKALSPGAIGVDAPTVEAAAGAARTGGFAAVEISPAQAVARGVESVRDALGGIAVAGFGLPFDWRGEHDAWQHGLSALPAQAAAMAALDCRRCTTWVLPMSDSRDFADNAAFHIGRLAPIAEVLAGEGIALGLEYVGPKTMRDAAEYAFAHTMREMLDLAAETGENVGLLLDCWHWYTSHESVADVEALRPEQVVYVHVNDAPKGVEIDHQIDNVREVVGATGVIDLPGFLGALRRIGYDGPVVCEPFDRSLSDLPDDASRLRKVGEAMDRALA